MKYPDNLNREERRQYDMAVKRTIGQARLKAEAVNEQKYELGVNNEDISLSILCKIR